MGATRKDLDCCEGWGSQALGSGGDDFFNFCGAPGLKPFLSLVQISRAHLNNVRRFSDVSDSHITLPTYHS